MTDGHPVRFPAAAIRVGCSTSSRGLPRWHNRVVAFVRVTDKYPPFRPRP